MKGSLKKHEKNIFEKTVNCLDGSLNMRRITQAELARELNCSRAEVTKLKKAGDYRLIFDGKLINADETIKLLRESGFGLKAGNGVGGRPKQIIDPFQDPDSELSSKFGSEFGSEFGVEPNEKQVSNFDFTTPVKSNETTAALQRRLHYEKVRKAQYDNDVNFNKVINIEIEREKWYKIARNVRDTLEAVVPRVAPKLVMKEQFDIEQTLTAAIKQVLTALIDDVTGA